MRSTDKGARLMYRARRFDGFPVGAVNGLSHMNVESGVVVPRHQPFGFVAVKDFLIFQRAQKPGTQVNGNSARGTPFSS